MAGLKGARTHARAIAAIFIALALPIYIATPLPARAQDSPSPEATQIPVAEQMSRAVQIAVKALDRGYGQTCDLKAMPTPTDGYYPCIDIGPYRFVREYANAGFRIAGYLVAGGEPFRFLESSSAGTNLLIQGPWETDLLPRAVKFEGDISGANAERKRLMEPETKRAEAERRLRDFQNKEKPDAGVTDEKKPDTKGASK